MTLSSDSLIHHNYIALGKLQFVISEINDSAPTPLQAVKLLTLYFSSPNNKASTPNFSYPPHLISSYAPPKSCWNLRSPALRNGLVISPSKIMPHSDSLPIDEDHTLTQLANAWLDLAVVTKFCL
ncbi:Coatomer subunit epsilon-1 [Spatholobus suberectus]|nr:Coatomer subunit epsilon-1 [Spatholobus suberectus]